jgi:hypothetical protein
MAHTAPTPPHTKASKKNISGKMKNNLKPNNQNIKILKIKRAIGEGLL